MNKAAQSLARLRWAKPDADRDQPREAGKKGGRKPVLKPCRYCGAEMGTSARRTHEPKCPKKIKEN